MNPYYNDPTAKPDHPISDHGRPVTLIHELDFSKFVSDHYRRPYVFQQQGDMKPQNSIERFTVPDVVMGDHWQAVTLAEWLAATPPDPHDRSMDAFTERLRWDREFYPELEDITNDLHAKGLIAAGDYALHIWW